MGYPSLNFIINYFFNKENKTQTGYLVHNRRFQFFSMVVLSYLLYIKQYRENEELRKVIASENKKLRGLREV